MTMLNEREFYRKLTEAVSNGIMKAIDGDEMFDNDETDMNPLEDDVEDSSVYVNHSKLYDRLLNSDIIQSCVDSGISLSFVCNDGKEHVVTDDIRNAKYIGHPRFVKFSTDELLHGENGTDNSIVISTCWKEHFDRIVWQESDDKEYGGQVWQQEYEMLIQYMRDDGSAENDFDGYLNTMALLDKVTEQGKDYRTSIPVIACAYDTTEELNGRTVHGYLPAMGQLRFMSDYIDLINDVLKLLCVEQIDFRSTNWWSSTEYDDLYAWLLCNGETDAYAKTGAYYALPLFQL